MGTVFFLLLLPPARRRRRWLDDLKPGSALRSRSSAPSLSTERRNASRTRVSTGQQNKREKARAEQAAASPRAFVAPSSLALRETTPLLLSFQAPRSRPSKHLETPNRHRTSRCDVYSAVGSSKGRLVKGKSCKGEGQIVAASNAKEFFPSLSLSLLSSALCLPRNFFFRCPSTRAASKRTDARTRLATLMHVRCCARVREKSARDRWGARRRGDEGGRGFCGKKWEAAEKRERSVFFFQFHTSDDERERESVLPFFSLFFLVFATTLLFSLHASVRVSSRSK